MPDEQLVQLSSKDENCYYYLIKRYEAKILRYIHRATNVNKEESEDLLQDIFIKRTCFFIKVWKITNEKYGCRPGKACLPA